MGDAFNNRKRFWFVILGIAMVLIIVFVAIFATVSALHIQDDGTNECLIDLNQDLTFHHPLILTENGDNFLNPGPNGIQLQAGEKLLLVCSGSNNHHELGSHQRELTLQCVKQKIFQTQDHNEVIERPFKDFKCSSYPESKAKKSGKKCSEKYTEIEIGFETSKGFVKVITTCFNENKKDSLYSYYNLLSTISQQQAKVPRPDEFRDGGFYSGLPSAPNTLYKKTSQLSTVSRLLKSDEQAKKFIKMNDDEFFLSRGHLTAKADFLYGAQQRATFYFINAAPQWQIFNKQNWNILEQDVRLFASKQSLDLTVYTGTWGITTLPDEAANQVPLYLSLDRKGSNHQLTAPEIYWKLLYHTASKKAIAFVGHNSPYEQDIHQRVVCKDVSEKVDWLHWRASNVTEGYSYCCEVDDLRRTVNYLPMLEVSGLLT